MVMENMEQGSLMDFLTEQERFPLEEALVKRIVRQVAGALAGLHELHVVHRDVKFHNILVSSGGTCFRLTDFGTAC